MNLPVNTIVCGDCLEVMKDWPDNCVDTIITDPPYGLGFMGKDWDTFTAANIAKKTAKHKPIDHNLQRERSGSMHAGSYDFSRNAEFQQWFTLWAKECLRVCKPGAFMLIFGGTRTYHRLACAIEDAGWQIRDCMMWLYGSGFPKSSSISLQFDKVACLEQLTESLGRKPTKEELKKAWETFRKQYGEVLPSSRTTGASQTGIATTFREKIAVTPQTDLARLWDGYGTALKPAWEPIIVAMKPLDGTFAANAEKHGVAGLNIAGGRIGTEKRFSSPAKAKKGTFNCSFDDTYRGQEVQGRWPANLILDEEAAAMLDEQMPETAKGYGIATRGQAKGKGSIFNQGGVNPNRYDMGGLGASRFFYCAKASRSERNAGLQGSTPRQADQSRDPKNPGGNNPRNRGARKDTNFHPTIKPLALMEYLCTLTRTPAGGIVLDPFGGSGTTAMACVKAGRDYILIEKDPEYCEIARRRVAEQKIGQQALFERKER